ncbi:MAG: dihydrolipoyl dehydrogenase [Anaerolineae bacterium]|nr:dihydrolipoyl dehydrogenase [Anaerolineae bacterium]
MTEIQPYDIAIIGGGPGGYVAAIRAAQLGARVALIEKERVGGMCLNWGCIPTKALAHQAELYGEIRRAAEFGIDVGGPVAVNFPRMMARKDEVVEALVSGVEELIRAHRVDLYPGLGTILKPDLVRVTPSAWHPSTQPTEVQARRLILATGSLPVPVPVPGHDLPGVVNARGLLSIGTQPRELIVIGASVVGVEFASIFAALGTRVTLLGRRTFLKDADEQLARRFRPLLARQGVRIEIGLEFRQIVQVEGGRLRVEYERAGQLQGVEADLVLSSTGHAPYTAELGLENVGLATERGRIVVNEYLETSVPGIYAIGDVTGVYMLAHVASHQGIVAVHNALGRREAMDYRAVPNCIYTVPEIAGVGLTERQAREAGIEFVTSRFPFSVNGRALGMGATEGQVRMLCAREADGRGGKVLGVHIMGPRASDLIAEATLAMQLGATAEDIARTIHQHPTLPEALMEAAMEMGEGAIHYRKVAGREG